MNDNIYIYIYIYGIQWSCETMDLCLDFVIGLCKIACKASSCPCSKSSHQYITDVVTREGKGTIQHLMHHYNSWDNWVSITSNWVGDGKNHIQFKLRIIWNWLLWMQLWSYLHSLRQDSKIRGPVHIPWLVQSAGAGEFTDCISVEW